MKLKIAQVIGLNTDQKAAQVVSNIRGDQAFLAVLDLSCDDAFTKGRQALSEIADFYFDLAATGGEKLLATFEEAKKKLEGEFSLLLATISGKVLYVIGQGQIEVILKRSDKLSPLLSVGGPNQLISGFLQGGDRLLLSTPSLTHFLGEDLEKSLNLPPDTFEEEVADRIGTSDSESHGLAGLVVQVESEEESMHPGSSLEEPASPMISQTHARLNIFSIIISPILNLFSKLRLYFPSTGRGRLIVAIVLIVIIVLGVGYKYKNVKDTQKQNQFNQLLQLAKADFEAAKGLTTLNAQEAKKKLDNAKDKINQALLLKPQDDQGHTLKKQIEDESSSILQQVSVSEFPQFYDMDLVKKNFRGTQMSLSNGKLLLLDEAVKTLVIVDIAKKSNQILAGSEQLGEAKFASLNGGLAFIYSKDKGLLRIDTTKNNLAPSEQKITTVGKKDSDLGEIKDIYGFAGNIYLLDSTKNQIWKYLPTSDGYSDKREYLTKNTQSNFADALRMQIESSVYLLKKDGEIVRFTRGEKDNFSYSGLDKGVNSPKSFFVSSDTDNLYLLDSGNSRLLILTKTGSYKGQVNGEKFAQASDLVVDEVGKKVYLLDGSKIYMVDLK